jgi:cytochrome c peroxidase
VPVQATLAAIPPTTPRRRTRSHSARSCSSTAAYLRTARWPAAPATIRRKLHRRTAVSIGIKGRHGQRNSPTVLNALYNKFQFWDGRATTLEDQAVLPIQNPSEMGQPNLDAAVAAIAKHPEYQQAFQKVFGRLPNGSDLGRAIASYERSQFSFASPFDDFIAGNKTAISASAKRGWALFNSKARCNLCHALTDTKQDPTFFMDQDFHNIGIGIIRHNVVALACKAQASLNSGNAIAVDQAAIMSNLSVLGRFLVTKKQPDIASFKTPSIRNVLITAPAH